MGVGYGDFRHVLHRFDQVHAALALAHGALDFRMAGVTDHDHLLLLGAQPTDLDVDLGDQRAGGVEHLKAARGRFFPDRQRHTVRGEHQHSTGGHLAEFLDEHGALGAQVVDHVAVVHHLVTHVHRFAVQGQCTLDDLDGAIDAGAETAWIGEQDLHQGLVVRAPHPVRHRSPIVAQPATTVSPC